MKQTFLKQKIAMFAAIFAVGLAGCATAPQQANAPWPEPRPLGKEFTAYRAPSLPSQAVAAVRFDEPRGEIALRQALAAALLKNPELAAFSWQIRAAEARTLQARLLPNPELGGQLENFAGSGSARDFNIAESTLQLSQLIELGFKRSKRMRVASLDRTVAALDYEAKRLEVFRAVAQGFIAVLSAQRRFDWADEAVQLTEKFAPAAQKRVEAGAASQVELIRFNLQTAAARNDREQARRDLAAARKRLSALWGSAEPSFERVAGDLEKLPTSPSLEESNQRLGKTPALKRWESELARREAAIALERVKAVPDVTVGAGVRHLSEPSDNAAVVQFSLPLPLFNRNQGAIREAQAEASRGEEQRRATEVLLRTDLRVAYEDLASSQAQIKTLKEHILPRARDAFDKVNAGYLTGRFTYLEIVDAQNTLIQANLRYISTLAAYLQAVAEIEGLTGRPLNELLESDGTK